MKYLTSIIILLLFASCARKVHTEKSITTSTKDSTYHFADTSKMVVATKVTEVTNYGGDSLQTTLYLPKIDTVLVDSINSNGIKIGYALSPFLGGFKLKIQAIAKPKSTAKTTEIKSTEQKGIAASGEVKFNTETKTKGKATESKGFPWGWLIGAIALLILALFIIK